jgi:Putative Flp pilus-assembly TadE/G-like
MSRIERDTGSTVPLILGLFLIALLVVAGAVAAGDAFVAQNQLQDECDGAAVSAATSADVDGGRRGAADSGGFLVLADVQSAVDRYRQRDVARTDVTMVAAVGPDGVTVTVRCRETHPVAFGSLFGFGDGVAHNATSTSRGRLRAN